MDHKYRRKDTFNICLPFLRPCLILIGGPKRVATSGPKGGIIKTGVYISLHLIFFPKKKGEEKERKRKDMAFISYHHLSEKKKNPRRERERELLFEMYTFGRKVICIKDSYAGIPLILQLWCPMTHVCWSTSKEELRRAQRETWCWEDAARGKESPPACLSLSHNATCCVFFFFFVLPTSV